MLCFNHLDSQAVGICKSCQRALCQSCVSEVGKSIACSNRCEDDVKGLNEMVDFNLQMIRTTDMKKLTADSNAALRWSKSIAVGADWFVVVLGSVFLAYAVYDRSTFLAVLGVCFIAFGVFGLVRTRISPPTDRAAS